MEEVDGRRDEFSAPFGLQINLSCPNTGGNPGKLITYTEKILGITETVRIPVMLKYGIASAPTEAVVPFNKHPGCDAICVSNTVPYNLYNPSSTGVSLPRKWKKVSPLGQFGGGGISGRALRRPTCEWIADVRDGGFTKPINGGGGILHPDDVNQYHTAGASSVFIGSVAILRPWRVRKIIRRAETLDWK